MARGGAINLENHFDTTPTEGKRTYAIIVCLFASLGGLFFGYDQGVTGGVLVMDSFIDDFCVGEWHGFTHEQCTVDSKKLPREWLDYTLWYNMTYNIGSMFGAFFGGWVADKFGRRVTIFNAGVLFCIGTTWVCFNAPGEHTSLLIARFIQGMGVGNSSFSLPIFGAEMAPKELRGFLSGFMQMTIVTGLLLSNVVNVIVEDHKYGWRITNSVAMAPPLIVMGGIFFVPESPRWTYVHMGKAAAERVLKKLRQTENVGRELQAIGFQIAEEGQEATWKDLLKPAILRRIAIAMFLQVLQQGTGINPMFSYGGLIFKDVAGDGIISIFLLSVVNFVSTIPAMRWVDTFGRRQLLLIGSWGMVVGHLIAGITFTAGCDGNTDKSGCGKASGYIIVLGTAFFIFNFAISWGPVCWIYPAEIFPLNARAKAVSLSTMANWIMGTCMTWVVKLFPPLNINGVFFLFAGTCAGSGAFVYYFCPETKGILLEDIEALFVKGKKTSGSPKYVDLETPASETA
jgi:MFS transporter, SP family, sugar:H+ symporter